MQQLILDIRPDAPPTFDNFLPGPNEEPVQALLNRNTPALPYAGDHVVYLWGETGVGKSHLLHAWSVHSASAYHAHGPLPDDETPLLAVDNVTHLAMEDQTRLFGLLNTAREMGGRIVAAGPLPPTQLTELGMRPDLATRLAQGLVYRLHPLTDNHKAQAIAIRASARGLHLDGDIVTYMLRHCRRDLPHLLALVDGLDTLSLSRKRPASLALLKELLLTAT